jgi:hypothetical protein
MEKAAPPNLEGRKELIKVMMILMRVGAAELHFLCNSDSDETRRSETDDRKFNQSTLLSTHTFPSYYFFIH